MGNSLWFWFPRLILLNISIVSIHEGPLLPFPFPSAITGFILVVGTATFTSLLLCLCFHSFSCELLGPLRTYGDSPPFLISVRPSATFTHSLLFFICSLDHFIFFGLVFLCYVIFFYYWSSRCRIAITTMLNYVVRSICCRRWISRRPYMFIASKQINSCSILNHCLIRCFVLVFNTHRFFFFLLICLVIFSWFFISFFNSRECCICLIWLFFFNFLFRLRCIIFSLNEKFMQ